MRTKTLTTVLLAALTAFMTSACSKHKYESVDGDSTKTRIYTLENGLKVYLSVNKEQPRIQTFIAVRTGSKNDPAETTGLAHYLEHLMFKGTDKYGVTAPEAEAPLLADIEQRYEKYRKLTDPAERRQAYHEIDSVSQLAAQYFIPNEYDKLMAIIGSEGSNAYTSNDVTCYVEDIPANEVENWAKIEAERFQNMTIRGFHTELEAVYEEYNMHLSSDGDKEFNALMAKLFPNHPYGTQTTIGTQEHLKNPSITNIKEYFKKWYVPNNVAICMAGDLDPDQVIDIISKHFGSWQPGDDVEQPVFGELAPITGPQDTTVVGLESENVWLGWRFEKAASAQADTLEVISNMLSNGVAGLFDLNVNQQMKMLGAGAYYESLLDHSCLILVGDPLEGQSLDEARQILLGEMEKLKKGDFSDDLLPSVVSNMKLQYFNSIENNRSRASYYVDAFVNGIDWADHVHALDRIAGMTKEQIVDFAKRHFDDHYVTVFKRQGTDPTQKKIEKPQITPIPSNRDAVSQYVKDIQDTKVDPIEPQFVDFEKDLTLGKTDNGLPYVYVQNKENGRFQLTFRYDFGSQADLRYDYASELLDYIGTDELSPEQVKQQFYKLACSYSVNVGERSINVSLRGLSENMGEALVLLDKLMKNAVVDNETYQTYVALLDKSRQDAKLDQRTNFSCLRDYGTYGPNNPTRSILTTQQLMQTDPQELLALLRNLSAYEHRALYYGPLKEDEFNKVVCQNHQVAEKPAKSLENRHFTEQATPENEVLIAPYDAKNIYMCMYHQENREWNPDEAPVKALFNEYFGGGMNTVVFQELRETRGLAYSAGAYYAEPTYKDEKESFLTSIITQNDKMMDCIRQFNVILNDMPQSDNGLQVAKDGLLKRLASIRATKFALINKWLQAQDLGIDYDLNKVIYEKVPALTMQDIADFARQQIANKTYRYIILGNEHDLDMKALGEIGPIRRVSTTEIFGY